MKRFYHLSAEALKFGLSVAGLLFDAVCHVINIVLDVVIRQGMLFLACSSWQVIIGFCLLWIS